MDSVTFASLSDGYAAACKSADVGGWSAEDFDAVLRSLNTVSYEVVGLAARIRAARAVNDTPVPHPVKPYTPPPPPPPKPQPEPQPKPAPPPPRPSKGQG